MCHEISSQVSLWEQHVSSWTMKKADKAYLSNRECSVQEVFYHILPELKLSSIVLSLYFVSTNLPKERLQELLSEK